MKTNRLKETDDEASQIQSPKEGDVTKIDCELTGTKIFSALASESQFGVAETRRLLGDFP